MSTAAPRAMPAALVVVSLLAAALAPACGAGDKLSGTSDPFPALCPTFREIAPRFTGLIAEDRFSGLREVLEQELGAPLDPRSPNGATLLSAVLGVVIEVVRVVDVGGFKDVLVDLLHSTDGGSLLPQAVGLFRYLDGQLGCPAATACDHYDLLDKLRLLLTSSVCTEGDSKFDAKTILDLLIRLVRHPRLPELLDLFPRLLSNPSFKGVIDGFRFENCGEGTCEQEDGFVALIKILVDNVIAPGEIPWQTIRDLMRQVGLQTPELTALLSLAEELLTARPASPDLDVLTPLRAALKCSRVVDRNHVISRNLYRLLSLDEVSLDGLLGGVDSLLDADPERKTLLLIAQALEYFRDRSVSSFRTLQLVLDVLLAPEQARRVIPSLIALVLGGVIPEITNLLIALTEGCTAIPRPEP